MNADGSGQTRLTDDAINGTGDDWSPNTYTPAGGLSRSAHKRITLRLG